MALLYTHATLRKNVAIFSQRRALAFLKPYHDELRTRNVAIERISNPGACNHLAQQRLKRPIAPHLTIYKWRYTSLASALHRLSGLALAGSLYAFGTLYLVGPTAGLHWDSATLVAAASALPATSKVALKFVVAVPFAYHGFNGLKHLIWDSGSLLGKKQSTIAARVVLAATVSTSLGLALWKF